MIVGTTKLDYERLKQFEGNPDELIEYVDMLVPSWALHIKGIASNQRFYVAIHLRKLLTIPYKPRMELVNALVSGIRIAGVITQFTPITDIVDICDKQLLVKMLESRNEKN